METSFVHVIGFGVIMFGIGFITSKLIDSIRKENSKLGGTN